MMSAYSSSLDMITKAQQAWVIHKAWSGDASARVTFFTEEYGLVRCLFKGGRTPKKQALLQSFTPLWLSLSVKGEAYFVHQLEIASPPINLQGKYLFAGLYVNELLYYSLKLQDPHAQLYRHYLYTLETLLTTSERFVLEATLRRFEWSLLCSCGYPMSFTHEAECFKPICTDAYYQFIPGEGFILADKGILGEHLLALSQDNLEDRKVLHVAKWVMRRAIEYLIEGREIKARQLFGAGDKKSLL